MTPWRDCWACFAIGAASCAAVVILLHRAPAPPQHWARLETTWSRYHEFRSLKLGPTYPWRHQCERALPSSGMETIGRRTVFREWGCVRIGR